MDTHRNEQIEQEFFELICYMVTSARNLISENRLYGPFRLLEAASRLLDIVEKLNVKSARLEAIKKQIEDGKYSVMESEEKFTRFLEDLVMALVPLMDQR